MTFVLVDTPRPGVARVTLNRPERMEEVLATLTPEQRQFVEDLAESTRTGTPPDNETGRVTVYFLTSCP